MEQTVDAGTLTLTFGKDLLSTDVNEMLSDAQAAIEAADGMEALHIDLTGTDTIDSQGLNLLVGLYKEAQAGEIDFKVVNPTAQHKQLFGFVKLSERFGVA